MTEQQHGADSCLVGEAGDRYPDPGLWVMSPLVGAIGQMRPLKGADWLQRWLSAATPLTASSDGILLLFLPVLMFEAVLSLVARRLINGQIDQLLRLL